MKIKLMIIIISLLIIKSDTIYSQATVANNAGSASQFLGWIGNYHLNFKTNNIQRMRINGTYSSVINSGTINTTGFVGISNNPTFWSSAQGPFSLLHLAAGTNSTFDAGYKSWMADGLTFTANNDLGFLGLRTVSPEISEYVLAWADNDAASSGPDDFVFRWTAGGTSSSEGLEIMRLVGQNNGRVGIGDEFGITPSTRPQKRLHVHDPSGDRQFRISYNISSIYTDFRSTSPGNLIIYPAGGTNYVGIDTPNEPTEKIDVNGNGRFRNVPILTPECLILGDQQAGGAMDIRMTRLDFNGNSNTYLSGNGTWQNTNACDWNLVNTNDVATGYVGACRSGFVGIGTNNPLYKFNIDNALSAGQTRTASIYSVGTDKNIGLQSDAYRGTDYIVGINGTDTTNSTNATTVQAPVIGVRGYADVTLGCSYRPIGIYGEAIGNQTCNGAVTAGYFAGAVYLTGNTFGVSPPITLSDKRLKKDIEDINSPLTIINKLKPRTDFYNDLALKTIGVDETRQYGFIAQEVKEVIPELTADFEKPLQKDENGNLYGFEDKYIGVKYEELIPILTGAIQQLSKQNEELVSKLKEIESKINEISISQNSKISSAVDLLSQNNIVLDQNDPNPFNEKTTIHFLIPSHVKHATIIFTDNTGKLIKSVDIIERGQQSLNVFGSELSNGTYYYSLIIDGKNFGTKKMVKVN